MSAVDDKSRVKLTKNNPLHDIAVNHRGRGIKDEMDTVRTAKQVERLAAEGGKFDTVKEIMREQKRYDFLKAHGPDKFDAAQKAKVDRINYARTFKDKLDGDRVQMKKDALECAMNHPSGFLTVQEAESAARRDFKSKLWGANQRKWSTILGKNHDIGVESGAQKFLKNKQMPRAIQSTNQTPFYMSGRTLRGGPTYRPFTYKDNALIPRVFDERQLTTALAKYVDETMVPAVRKVLFRTGTFAKEMSLEKRTAINNASRVKREAEFKALIANPNLGKILEEKHKERVARDMERRSKRTVSAKPTAAPSSLAKLHMGAPMQPKPASMDDVEMPDVKIEKQVPTAPAQGMLNAMGELENAANGTTSNTGQVVATK